ncbi:MAG TPA: hypothetical protein VF551_03455, partial [Chthoniobacterales bacterium]
MLPWLARLDHASGRIDAEQLHIRRAARQAQPWLAGATSHVEHARTCSFKLSPSAANFGPNKPGPEAKSNSASQLGKL